MRQRGRAVLGWLGLFQCTAKKASAALPARTALPLRHEDFYMGIWIFLIYSLITEKGENVAWTDNENETDNKVVCFKPSVENINNNIKKLLIKFKPVFYKTVKGGKYLQRDEAIMETRSQTIKSPSVEWIWATSHKKRENRGENKTYQSQSVAVRILLAAPRVTQMRNGSQATLMAVSAVYLLAQWICPNRQTDRHTASWAGECRANTPDALQTSRRALKCTKTNSAGQRKKERKKLRHRFLSGSDPDLQSLHRVGD